jgi:hypothetical protein
MWRERRSNQGVVELGRKEAKVGCFQPWQRHTVIVHHLTRRDRVLVWREKIEEMEREMGDGLLPPLCGTTSCLWMVMLHRGWR